MTKKMMAAAGIIGFLATAGIAFAQAAQSEQMLVQIGPAGKVLLRGTIDSVSASSLSVKSWGGDWTVNVGPSATVLPQGVALSSFKQGDFVGVQGSVDSSAAWTVTASLVRDWTARAAETAQIKANVEAVKVERASAPRTVQGTLSNLGATAQTFTLTNAAGTAFSVSLASGAKLLASNWATLDFSKVSNGDTVRVYGPVASSTITASIFRDVSVK